MPTAFKRLKKKHYRGRKRGDPFPVRKPDWNRRSGYILQKGKVVPAIFKDGKMVPLEGELNIEGSMKRGYETPDQTCPDLTPSKAAQRQELLDKVDSGQILETHAGKGHLSEMYAKSGGKELIMVEQNPSHLKEAEKRVKGTKHQAIVSDNLAWLENEMKPNQLKRLKMIDADAFGCPADALRTFFKNFPIRRKMHVALTDGSKIWLGYKKGDPKDQARWMKKHYGIVRKSSGTREDQVKLLDAFMQAQAQVHGFKVKPVNVAYGKHHAVYAGYEISPEMR